LQTALAGRREVQATLIAATGQGATQAPQPVQAAASISASGGPPRRGLKRIATGVAMFAANPAFHSALCQASVGHPRLDLPRRGLSITAWQRAILAGGGAGAAESALAAPEIEFRKAANDDDDPRRANRDAVAAATAGVDEQFFRQRPWRARRRGWRP
jgi:hypothetical protein